MRSDCEKISTVILICVAVSRFGSVLLNPVSNTISGFGFCLEIILVKKNVCRKKSLVKSVRFH
jgi:hypothetical protein